MGILVTSGRTADPNVSPGESGTAISVREMPEAELDGSFRFEISASTGSHKCQVRRATSLAYRSVVLQSLGVFIVARLVSAR